MDASNNDIAVDLNEKRIAAFAIENDHLHASLLTGHAVSKGDEHVFQYETVTDPQVRKLQPHLNSADLKANVGEFLSQFPGLKPDAVGISTYGALDTEECVLHATPNDRGQTDSGGQSRLDFRKELREVIGDAKLAVENDATAAAIGEYWWGAGDRGVHYAGHSTFAYIWVSRGVNAGVLQDGIPLAHRYRPETGHLRSHHYIKGGLSDPMTRSTCSKHERCITGMAGLNATLSRLAHDDLSDSEAIDMAVDYIAQLCATIALTVAPAQMALGGMQMQMPWVLIAAEK